LKKLAKMSLPENYPFLIRLVDHHHRTFIQLVAILAKY
jgi:hypothetical protein